MEYSISQYHLYNYLGEAKNLFQTNRNILKKNECFKEELNVGNSFIAVPLFNGVNPEGAGQAATAVLFLFNCRAYKTILNYATRDD